MLDFDEPLSLLEILELTKRTNAIHLIIAIDADGRECIPNTRYLSNDVVLVFPGEDPGEIEKCCDRGGHVIESINLVEHFLDEHRSSDAG